MKKLIPYFIAAIAPLCWAGDIVLAKGVSASIPPFTLVFWRWFVAALLMAPFAYKPVMKDLDTIKKSWGFLSVLSILGMSGFISLLYIGVRFTSANNSGLLQATLPVVIVFICFFMYGEKAKPVQYSGLALCILGALYVVFQGNLEMIKSVAVSKGDLIILLAVLMYGLYSALLPKSPDISPFSFLFCTSVIGAVTVLPFYACEIFFSAGTTQLNTQTFLSVLFVAIFPSIVAYWCWSRGVSEIGANRTGIFISLLPIFVAVLACPFLKEPMEIYHVIGMCLIFSGMILFNRTSSTPLIVVSEETNVHDTVVTVVDTDPADINNQNVRTNIGRNVSN